MKPVTATPLCVLAAAIVLGGCVSAQTKSVAQQFNASEKVYGMVSQMWDAGGSDTPGEWLRTQCKNGTVHSAVKGACVRPEDYKIARITVLLTTGRVTTNLLIPKSANAEVRSIVEFNGTAYLGGFARVARQKPTEDCQWTGRPLATSAGDQAASVAGAALAGFISGPIGLVAFNSDTAMMGGVECEGWSYKTYWQKAGDIKTSSLN